jgi:predicted nucleic acid-binding protein
VAHKVFVDTNLLIAAARGEEPLRECALAVLNEPNIEFWYSPILRLEATLQPAHHKRELELAFMDEYFNGANCLGNLNNIYFIAYPDASKHGIPVLDALHVAAAHLSKCKVLVTAEKDTKPMFRTELVKVVSIRSLAETRRTGPDHVRKFLQTEL